jgi:hypothetical protein
MFSEQEHEDLRERIREDMERFWERRAEQERVVREPEEMTVVDLLDMFEPEGDQDNYLNHKKVEEVLALILGRAIGYYDDEREDSISELALCIAWAVVKADGIDKARAKVLASDMAALADYMLKAEGAGEWEFGTLIALKKIRRSDPDFAKEEQKQGGYVIPKSSNGKTQAEIDAEIVF